MSFLLFLWYIFYYSVISIVLLWISKELLMGICYSEKKLNGKVVLITGGTAGIGKATAIDLAKRGATVIITGRTKYKTSQAANDISKESNNDGVYSLCLDLSSQKDVRKFAREVKEKFPKIHYLINNAGMINDVLDPLSKEDPETLRKTTEDGFELTMATNFLGPVTLTEYLLENLKLASLDSDEPCRIINVSSMALLRSDLDLEMDLNRRTKPYHGNMQYFNSKLAQVWYSNELARKLRKHNIESVSLHPGAVRTEVFRNSKINFITQIIWAVFILVGKNSWQGAQTTIHCVVSDEKLNGKFLYDCREPWHPISKLGIREIEKKCYKHTKSLLNLK